MTRTLVLGHRPEIDELLARRRALGLDRQDEVWEGVYHVAPEAHPRHGIVQAALLALLTPPARRAGLVPSGPFNLGQGVRDYRVPDLGFHEHPPATLYVPAAPVVGEVLSPDDESYPKFGFYHDHGVREILVADPLRRVVECWVRDKGGFAAVERSDLLGVAVAEMAAIGWP
jgi:hypothetical protein